MRVGTIGRRTAGLLLALALAAGTAGAAAAAEPVRGAGWIRTVDLERGRIQLLDGRVLALSRTTEIRDAEGQPVLAVEIPERTEEARRVRFQGDLRGGRVELERLVVAAEPPR